MRTWSLCLAVLFLSAAARPARADELTAQEKTWAKSCVEGLSAPTVRQREGAAAALGRLGTAALPTVLENTARLKTDEHWAALEAACVLMGIADASAALDVARPTWPKAQAERLDALVIRLRQAALAAGIAPPPLVPGALKSPQAVAAEVDRILASFATDKLYIPSDPRIGQLADLGHDALGALLDATKTKDGPRYPKQAALEAAERLVRLTDLPEIERMLADGHLSVGRTLRRLPAAKVVPVLLVPVKRGLLSYELMEGLEVFANDARVPKALIAWLEAQVGEDGSSLCGNVADTLEKVRAKEAIPILAKIMVNRDFPNGMRRAASAVAGLGDKRGILALIEYFRDPPREFGGVDTYDRHAAGEELNRLVGRAVYVGSYGYPAVSDAKGNFDEAAREFAKWWERSKASLRFDEERRAWSLGK